MNIIKQNNKKYIISRLNDNFSDLLQINSNLLL